MSKIPKLRFKEFSGEWESKRLGELGDFKKTYSFSRSVEGKGDYKHIHYGDIHMNYNGIISKDKLIPSIDIPSDDNYELIKEKDIIFADASEDRKDLGKVAVVRSIEGNVLSGLHTMCFRPKETLNSEFFLNHSLNKEYLKFMYTRGNGAKVLGISKANLLEYKFLAPSKEEQEKIASFFSLIDDKISLQGEKIEALKDYKKGIMQKIFSRELRFKDDDGRDYSEWAEKKLGDITDIGTGSNDLQDKVEGGKYPFFVRSANVERINSYTFDGEAILIPGDGNIGQIYHYINGKFAYHQRVYKISNFVDGVSGKYIYYYMSRFFLKEALKNSVKATVDSLRLPTLTEMNVLLPCIEEQEKITRLLSELEDKVKKEKEKLDSLNEYKRGLLQQMFV